MTVRLLFALAVAFAVSGRAAAQQPLKPEMSARELTALVDKAGADIKFVPLDVKFAKEEFTILAPPGARVESSQNNAFIQAKVGNGNFQLSIQLGKTDMPVQVQRWQNHKFLTLKGLVAQGDDVVMAEVEDKGAFGKPRSGIRVVKNATLGHLDFRMENQQYQLLTRDEALLLLKCANSFALKKPMPPIDSVEALEKRGVRPFVVQGKIVEIPLYDLPCTDSTLPLLAKVAPDVQQLYLPNQFTDAGLAALAKFKNLRSLTLSMGYGDYGPTGSFLKHLQGLTQLESLGLGFLPVEDSQLAHLKGMVNLRTLHLNHSNLTGRGFEHLKGLKLLETLSLDECPITDAGVAQLAGLVELRVLNLSKTKITDAGLDQLGTLINLETLTLRDNNLTGANFKALANLVDLQTLSLDRTQFSDEGCKHLAGLTNLRGLNLQNTQVTGAGFAALKGMRRLRFLDLGNTPTADPAMKHLAALPNLDDLLMVQTKITDAGLAELQGADLQTLDLSGTAINGSGLAKLKSSRQLRSLYLRGTKVNDAGLAALKNFPNLNYLTLDQTPVTDDGLKQLQTCRKLSTISANNTKISDAGLLHVHGLASLSNVNAFGTRVTKAGVDALKKALPKVNVFASPQ